MKKKLVALTLAAAMVASLCACGNDAGKEVSKESSKVEESKKEESKAEESAPAASEEAKDSLYPIVDEPITVKVAVFGKATDYREDRLVWNTVSEVTGINFEWEVLDNEALPTYMAGGDWADIIMAGLDATMVNDYGVLGGMFANFYDYIDVMPHLAQTFADYPIVEGASKQINGEIYCLPSIEASATVVSARPYVRTDVLDNAGLKMPTNVEEFENCLRVLKEKNGTVSFIPDFSNDESYWGPMLFAAFGPLTNMNFDDDGTGKVIYNRTSDQMRLYLEWMNKLYEEGLIHQEYLTVDYTVRQEAAQTGKVAFIGSGEGNGIQASHFADGEFHLDCCPALTSEYDSTQTILGKSNYYPGNLYVNAESEYVEEIMRMLDITHAQEEVVEGTGLCGMSFCYGMEGKDWDFGAEGSGTYIFHTPEKYDGAFTTYQYGELIWNNCGRQDAFAELVTETVGNSRARQIGFVNNVKPYMSDLYFPADLLKFTEDEQYVMDNKLTDLKTYAKEMEGKFITGVTDLNDDTWKEYCDTIDKMGVADVIEVYQASYDRWNGK